MDAPHIIEGTWEEIVQRDSPVLAGKRVTVYVGSDTRLSAESLESAVSRITGRSASEIASVRERILSSLGAPRELPIGTNVFDAVTGNWPGTESDEEINAALDRLS